MQRRFFGEPCETMVEHGWDFVAKTQDSLMILVGEARANRHAPALHHCQPYWSVLRSVIREASVGIISILIGLKDAASRMSMRAGFCIVLGRWNSSIVKQRKRRQQHGINCGDPQISTPDRTAFRPPFGVVDLGYSLSGVEWK